MIEKIKKLDNDTAKSLLVDFMEVYLDKGFGMMNKTDIETLMYYVFKKYDLLSGKCFSDSFALQIPEAKARKLIYESQVKYAGWNMNELTRHLRESVGELLTHAYISKNGKEIQFAIEDKYLRIALNAKLRSNHYFANTSFNKDIVSLDENAFIEMVSLLVPNFHKDKVLEKLTAITIEDDLKVKENIEFLKAVLNKIMAQMSVEGLKQLCKLIFLP